MEGEVKAVDQKLHDAETNIERYRRAFEAGTMPESICGPRIRALGEQVAELRNRKEELAAALSEQPIPPTDNDVTHTRHTIKEALMRGDERDRKALIHALTKEILITGRRLTKPISWSPQASVRRRCGRAQTQKQGAG